MLIKSKTCPWCKTEISNPKIFGAYCEKCHKPYCSICCTYHQDEKTKRMTVTKRTVFEAYLARFFLVLIILVLSLLNHIKWYEPIFFILVGASSLISLMIIQPPPIELDRASDATWFKFLLRRDLAFRLHQNTGLWIIPVKIIFSLLKKKNFFQIQITEFNNDMALIKQQYYSACFKTAVGLVSFYVILDSQVQQTGSKTEPPVFYADFYHLNWPMDKLPGLKDFILLDEKEQRIGRGKLRAI